MTIFLEKQVHAEFRNFLQVFWVYRAGAGAEAGAWDGALVVLGVRVVSTGTSLGWFDPAEVYWAFLQEREFDAIVAELEQVVWTLDRGSIICKTLY